MNLPLDRAGVACLPIASTFQWQRQSLRCRQPRALSLASVSSPRQPGQAHAPASIVLMGPLVVEHRFGQGQGSRARGIGPIRCHAKLFHLVTHLTRSPG
jgi:hypothetical protein